MKNRDSAVKVVSSCMRKAMWATNEHEAASALKKGRQVREKFDISQEDVFPTPPKASAGVNIGDVVARAHAVASDPNVRETIKETTGAIGSTLAAGSDLIDKGTAFLDKLSGLTGTVRKARKR